MPVGSGGEALGRIESASAAEDPAPAGAFRGWREPPWPDTTDSRADRVDPRTGLAPPLGLVAVAVGPTTILMPLALIVLLACFALGGRASATEWSPPTTGAP